ncbi:MAG TPA: MauE/DoxX family redox-associated membrane protein [Gaiellaceae bacterium]|nr:MauE/DoxX family redox-associated membrane protein [Gaiellaceae bacterium]
MSTVVRIALAVALLVAAGLKLASRDAGRAGLATFDVPPRARNPVWLVLICAEVGLAIGVAAGSDLAAYAASALCGLFGAALGVAVLRGRAGAPCGCFGARSRVGVSAVLRNALLAAAFATTPSIPSGRPSRDGWLAIGLAVTFALVLALGVAVLALAREVGLLRLRLGGESALEIAEEGPPLGERVGLIHRFRPESRTRLVLAVFSSEGCTLCKSLEPVIAAFRREPLVAVEVFDEVRDAEVWADLGIPGSPFAVALGRDGAVRAKGTFNSYGQLESILATAERRVAEAHA